MDGVVLAVDRQDGDAVARRRLGDDAARHDEDFLVGERDRLAQLDRRQHRFERFGSTRRAQHDFGIRVGSNRDQTVAPGWRNRDAAERRPFEPVDRHPCCHRGDPRPVARDLLGEELVVVAGGEPDHLQPIGMRVDHRQGAAADRAGRSEDGYAFQW